MSKLLEFFIFIVEDEYFEEMKMNKIDVGFYFRILLWNVLFVIVD